MSRAVPVLADTLAEAAAVVLAMTGVRGCRSQQSSHVCRAQSLPWLPLTLHQCTQAQLDNQPRSGFYAWRVWAAQHLPQEQLQALLNTEAVMADDTQRAALLKQAKHVSMLQRAHHTSVACVCSSALFLQKSTHCTHRELSMRGAANCKLIHSLHTMLMVLLHTQELARLWDWQHRRAALGLSPDIPAAAASAADAAGGQQQQLSMTAATAVEDADADVVAVSKDEAVRHLDAAAATEEMSGMSSSSSSSSSSDEEASAASVHSTDNGALLPLLLLLLLPHLSLPLNCCFS
jgi:hypothetical protein